MIAAVHAKIPGRSRFKVGGLKNTPVLAAALENVLQTLGWVELARASHLTGTVLVKYDPALKVEQAAAELEEIRRQAVQAMSTASHPGESGENAVAKQPGPPLLQGKLDGIKDMVGRMLHYAQAQPQHPWHAMEAGEVLAKLEADPKIGLDTSQVLAGLKKQGYNLPPEIESRSRWQILREQFTSLPVGLLGVAAGLSILTGGILDAAIIMGVVAGNGLIGYFTESSAETTIKSLKSLATPTALVLREGKQREIAAPELVAGDILVLKPGILIPADARVLKAENLTLDESTLTGESLPVEKTAKALERAEAALGDRGNMVYQGTVVTGGQGLAVVTATGARTELGLLQTLVQQTAAPGTPIERQLGEIGDHLVLLSAGICSLVFGVGFLRGYGLIRMARMSISLAAAAVPEGLPTAATTTLALGVSRMGKEGVLIRNLDAVETLGSIQTVCLDKTGTLTENRMKVMETYVGGRSLRVVGGRLIDDGDRVVAFSRAKELKRILQVSVLCSETRINGKDAGSDRDLQGSPTENALVEMAMLVGLDVKTARETHTLLEVNHRAEGRPLMCSLHTRKDGGRLMAVKGSPEEVLARSRWQKVDGVHVELTPKDRERILAENKRMAGDALRVLGLAYAKTRGDDELDSEKDLIWLGLIGMADPLRGGVSQAIAAFHRAGIRTVMLTGDQEATARSVAVALNISGGRPLKVLDSSKLNGDESSSLGRLAGEVDVFSRVSPSRKLRIVQELQKSGQVVAMTGDGVNDSPALKAAEVGIAMGGSGTDVAREVADVVLENDDLETVIIAVRDGRTTYANIRKSVHFFLATNISEIMIMFAALGLGLGSPLNTMQLLWINLISDIFPGLALSMEEPEGDVLNRPPRDPAAPIFDKRDYLQMVKESTIITASALGAYAYGLLRYGAGAAASTLAFQSLTIGQLLQALNCRSERRPFWDKSLKPNPYLRWALGGSLAAQALTMFVPGLRNLMGLTPLGGLDYAVLGASALLALFGGEASKHTPRPGGGKVRPKRLKQGTKAAIKLLPLPKKDAATGEPAKIAV